MDVDTWRVAGEASVTLYGHTENPGLGLVGGGVPAGNCVHGMAGGTECPYLEVSWPQPG